MNRIISCFYVFVTLPSLLLAQPRLSGFVRDSLTREVLIGAHVTTGGGGQAITTDNSGYFSLPVRGSSSVAFSYIGYMAKTVGNLPPRDTLIEVLLSPGTQIEGVVVTGQSRRPTFNVATLSTKELQSIPSLGGKPDVMKAIQLLPGIQSQNEGSSLIMVRGGNPGENLYLLDNVALIYVNHLGGFMSVFNPDMINSIDVYKGGFPARYGGKLSSIMDIAQREGSSEGFRGSFSVGVTDASLSLEGPTRLKNTTYMFTGRKTLVDPLFMLASRITGGGDYLMSYGFHDVNGKLTWRPNERNTLSVNLYQGDDYLNVWLNQKSPNATEKARISNVWGNWLLSTRWSRVHTPRLSSSQSLSFVRYRLNYGQSYSQLDNRDTLAISSRYHSSVQDVSYKWGWRFDWLRFWSMDFGVGASLLNHMPNSTESSFAHRSRSEPTLTSTETAVYIENKFTLGRLVELRVGARGVGYATSSYTSLDLEPRVSLNISPARNHALNISYMDVSQFSHLLFTHGSIMSNEVWVPSGGDVPPARSQQVSAGWRGAFLDGGFDAEVNLYHKTLSELAAYREGYTNLMGDGNWRSKVERGGNGRAYGLELMVRKNHGPWTGFASYAWSKAYRQFPGINGGIEYLFEYDRPHTASLSIAREINPKLTASIAWVYQAGLPFTPVIGRQITVSQEYFSQEPYYFEAFIYGPRNSERMSDYHRLDVALQYNTVTRRSGYKAQWTFGVYNAYNRRNPYYYYFAENNHEAPFKNRQVDQSKLWMYQVSFFPIIPTVSYKVFFDERVFKSEKPITDRLRRLLFY